MIFKDQFTLGRIPFALICGCLFLSASVLVIGYMRLTSSSAVVMLDEVTTYSEEKPFHFNEEYNVAIGSRFLTYFSGWNRYNISRQLGNAQIVSGLDLRGRLQQYLTDNIATWRQLRVTRESKQIDNKVISFDPIRKKSVINYLVRQNEWWGGQFQSSKLMLYTMQINAIMEEERKLNYLVEVVGVLVKDVTPEGDTGETEAKREDAQNSGVEVDNGLDLRTPTSTSPSPDGAVPAPQGPLKSEEGAQAQPTAPGLSPVSQPALPSASLHNVPTIKK